MVKKPEICTGKMTEPLRNGIGQPGWLQVKESKSIHPNSTKSPHKVRYTESKRRDNEV